MNGTIMSELTQSSRFKKLFCKLIFFITNFFPYMWDARFEFATCQLRIRCSHTKSHDIPTVVIISFYVIFVVHMLILYIYINQFYI